MSKTQELRQVKAAQNQLLFRSMNQQMQKIGERLLNDVQDMDFACECNDPTCVQSMTMPLADFKEIDRMHNRFLVLSGHEDLDVEEVMGRHDGYVVVAKRGAGEEYVRQHEAV